ncbi:MAG: NAD(P)-binding protein [Rubrivivax sp.]|nr:NAD(P)-binding protein [Rubrivivax sp.]
MAHDFVPQSIAVVGAGAAGAACALGLRAAGHRVTVFDKARGVGGRMATRRAQWTEATGQVVTAEFDHGAPHFAARSPRFTAALARAEAAGVLARWQPRVHVDSPLSPAGERFVPVPGMPALCRYWLADVPLRLQHTVTELRRGEEGWHLVDHDGRADGPFDQVVLAMPPQQAAALLAGHHDAWAQRLRALKMDPCWTLMAVTDEVDWPWDATEPPRGPLAWVARNDRQPGRTAPAGCAAWVAHATPAWSAAHLEETAAAVADELGSALQALLPRPSGGTLRWHHAAAHRWRYAVPVSGRLDPWWDASLGLGVCGDALGGGDVEGAWRSGDELADLIAIELEQSGATVATVD